LYLVVIGWLYVVVMMAAVSDSLLTALARLLFLGILPVAVLLWMGGLRRRRPRPSAEDARANEAPPDRTH
jgi:type VI protein secretion system component VasK